MPAALRADARYCSPGCRVAAHRSARRYDTRKKIALRGRTPAESDRWRHKVLQLEQYEAVIAAGGGTDWTRQKVADLRLELA
jgi:hypothetical protein